MPRGEARTRQGDRPILCASVSRTSTPDSVHHLPRDTTSNGHSPAPSGRPEVPGRASRYHGVVLQGRHQPRFTGEAVQGEEGSARGSTSPRAPPTPTRICPSHSAITLGLSLPPSPPPGLPSPASSDPAATCPPAPRTPRAWPALGWAGLTPLRLPAQAWCTRVWRRLQSWVQPAGPRTQGGAAGRVALPTRPSLHSLQQELAPRTCASQQKPASPRHVCCAHFPNKGTAQRATASSGLRPDPMPRANAPALRVPAPRPAPSGRRSCTEHAFMGTRYTDSKPSLGKGLKPQCRKKAEQTPRAAPPDTLTLPLHGPPTALYLFEGHQERPQTEYPLLGGRGGQGQREQRWSGSPTQQEDGPVPPRGGSKALPHPPRPRAGPLTCPQQDDLVVQGQLGEVRDPLGPLHQGEELLVGRLADVGDGVIGLGAGGTAVSTPAPDPSPEGLNHAPKDTHVPDPTKVPLSTATEAADVTESRVLRREVTPGGGAQRHHKGGLTTGGGAQSRWRRGGCWP